MTDVFVSYVSDERGRAGYAVSLLEAAGFSVWWDRSLKVGANFSTEIQMTLEQAKCVVVLWSKAALSSDWVRGEASYAHHDRKLVSLVMEDVRLPPPFNVLHGIDLRSWTGAPQDQAWFGVVRAVRQFVDPTGKTAMRHDDYVKAATARSGHLIHKLKAKDTTGRWAYYFVLVPPDREKAFLSSIEDNGIIDLETFGTVIASSYGETPSADVKAYLNSRFNFDV